MKKQTLVGILTTALVVMVFPGPSAVADGGNGDRAFTAWAFIFNFPEYCSVPCDADDLGDPDVAGAVIYLTGQRVQSNGRATFGGAISANSSHRQIGGSSPAGLMMPLTAEIHVGLQDHTKGSLSGDALATHNQVTNPCGPPCALVQATAFLPGEEVAADVHFWGTTDSVPGATANMTRTDTGVSISIDTRFK